MDSAIGSEAVCKFMRLAVNEARQALARLEVPVGCVIVENGNVIGSGSNRVNETRNATRHAEMEAIDMVLSQWIPSTLSGSESAKEQLTKKFGGCELYVTCEPCIMCAAALSILGIKKVYYGCANDRFGGCGSILPLHVDGCGGCGESSVREEPVSVKNPGFECLGGILADEGVAMLRGFYEQGNPNAICYEGQPDATCMKSVTEPRMQLDMHKIRTTPRMQLLGFLRKSFSQALLGLKTAGMSCFVDWWQTAYRSKEEDDGVAYGHHP